VPTPDGACRVLVLTEEGCLIALADLASEGVPRENTGRSSSVSCWRHLVLALSLVSHSAQAHTSVSIDGNKCPDTANMTATMLLSRGSVGSIRKSGGGGAETALFQAYALELKDQGMWR
jgi:hypothetical protein